MKLLAIIFFACLCSLLMSCQPSTKSKKTEEKIISFSLKINNLTSSANIYGKSSATNAENTLGTITASPAKLEIRTGTWKIYSFEKAANDPNCERVICGTSSQTSIYKEGQEIEINASSTSCNDSFFTKILASSCSLPTAPTSLALVSPASASHTETKPTVRITGLLNGGKVELHKDSNCQTLIATATITASSQDLTIQSSLPIGSHSIYAKQLNVKGVSSSCSTAKLNYTVQSSAIAVFNLTNFSSSAKVYSYNEDDLSPTINYLTTTATTNFSLPVAKGNYMFFVIEHSSNDPYCKEIKCDYGDHFITTGTNTITTFELYKGDCGFAPLANYYKNNCLAPLPPTSATLTSPSNTATSSQSSIQAKVYHPENDGEFIILSRDNACSTKASENSSTGTATIANINSLPGGSHRFYGKIKTVLGLESACVGPLFNYTVLPSVYFSDESQPYPKLTVENNSGGETITVRANTSTCTSGAIIDEFTITGTATREQKLSWSAVLNPVKDYAIQVKQGNQTYCFVESIDVSSSLLEGVDEMISFAWDNSFVRNRQIYYISSDLYPYTNSTNVYPYLYDTKDLHDIGATLSLTSSGELYNYWDRVSVQEVAGRRFSNYAANPANNTTCAIETNGQTICWGYNDYGQLGNGTTTSTTTPQIVLGLPSRAKSLALSDYSSCALLYSGSIYCWGANNEGQLGNGSLDNSYTPTLTSSPGKFYDQIISLVNGYCAKTIEGSVDCWGYNYLGQLGLGDYTSRSTPTTIPSLIGLVSSIAFSPDGNTVCAVLFSGELSCWGYNNMGSLGFDLVDTFPSPVRVGSPIDQVTKAFPSDEGICYQTDFARVKCLGNQKYSRLGDALIPASATPTMSNRYDQSSDPIIKLFSAPNHSATLYKTQSGKIYLQGEVTVDVLAYDRINPTISGQTLSSAGVGNNVYTVLTNSGILYSGTTILSPVTQLGASIKEAPYFASWGGCVLYTNGSVKCWGSYDGAGGTGTLNTPSTIFTNGVTQLAGNYDTHFAVTSAGELYGWGYNANKELGDDTTTNRLTPRQLFASGITAISSSGNYSCALNSNKEVICWGWSIGSTPVLISTLPKTATKVQMSQSGACSLHSDGSVYCWGDNQYGQLGQGGNYFSSSWTSTAKKVSLALPAIDISKGANHACALLTNKKLYCWGSNTYGELGVETWRNTPHYMLKNPNE